MGLALVAPRAVLEVQLARHRVVGRGRRAAAASLACLSRVCAVFSHSASSSWILRSSSPAAGWPCTSSSASRRYSTACSARANSWNSSRAFSASRSARARLSVGDRQLAIEQLEAELDVAAFGVEGAGRGQGGRQLVAIDVAGLGVAGDGRPRVLVLRVELERGKGRRNLGVHSLWIHSLRRYAHAERSNLA